MTLIYIILCVYIAYQIFITLWLRRTPEYGVTFIAGDIGSGKSTYAAKIAQKYIKNGWNVYSNVYIQGCYKINVEWLNRMVCPENSVIIIDEASLEMNSRNFAKMQLTMIAYMKLCRHYKNRVILISQTMTDTDKQIRDLAAKVYFIRKIIPGLISVPARVIGKLGIGVDGQPCVQYEIKKLGMPYFLPRWYKYFNSFDREEKPLIDKVMWGDEYIKYAKCNNY